MTDGIFDDAYSSGDFSDSPQEEAARSSPKRYALFVHGQVKGYFASNWDALRAALQDHAEDDFSVLRVEPQAA